MSEASGALAKGELCVGRVLGLPRPNAIDDGATQATEPFGKVPDDVSGGGEPGAWHCHL